MFFGEGDDGVVAEDVLLRVELADALKEGVAGLGVEDGSPALLGG